MICNFVIIWWTEAKNYGSKFIYLLCCSLDIMLVYVIKNNKRTITMSRLLLAIYICASLFIIATLILIGNVEAAKEIGYGLAIAVLCLLSVGAKV